MVRELDRHERPLWRRMWAGSWQTCLRYSQSYAREIPGQNGVAWHEEMMTSRRIATHLASIPVDGSVPRGWSLESGCNPVCWNNQREVLNNYCPQRAGVE